MTTSQDSSTPPKRLGFATIAALGVLAIVVFLSALLGATYALYDQICRFAIAIGYESTSEMSAAARFVRDIAILFAGAFGILLAAGRNYYLDKQIDATNEQARAATKQAETAAKQFASAEKRMIDDQFAKAAESARRNDNDGKPLIEARISGINDMAKLAITYSEEFAERVVIYLIAYVKRYAQLTATPELEKGAPIPAEPRILGADVKAAFDVLNDILGIPQIKEMIEDKILDFSRANFSGLNLNLEHVRLDHYKRFIETDFRGADLRKATFKGEAILNGETNLRGAKFQGAYLNGTYFYHVNMRDARLNTDLSGADMTDVDLHSADLRGAKWDGGYLLKVIMSGTDVRGAKLRTKFQRGTTLSARYGATDMTDSDFDMQFPDDAKEHMCNRIWHYPALWAKGKDIAEYSPGAVDLQLEQWDCYALAGLVRNFEHERHLKGASDIAKWARQLLDEDGKVPPESAQLIERILSGGHR